MVIGAPTMTNSDFLAEIYGELEPGTHGWVCSFAADPSNAPPAVWGGRAYKGMPNQAALIDRSVQDNTYYCTAVLTATEDGEIVRRKEAFVRLAVLVLDDVQLEDVQGYSYALQTSPGKFQVGILLDEECPDCADKPLIDRVMSALAARGRSNDASGNACVRYVRLCGGSNTKPRPSGVWEVKLHSWNPNVRWTLDDACAAVGIDLDSLRIAVGLSNTASTPTSTGTGTHAGEMIAALTAPVGERAYHDNITRLAASLVAGGMYPGAACEFLYSLMDEVKPAHRDAEEFRRWETRRQEIPRAVKSAEKFAPENRQPPKITVNLNLADEPEEEPAGSPGEPVPMDWEALHGTTPEATRWRLDGWLPEGTVTLLSANGGVGKSNLSLQLGVAMAMGFQFMGLETQPGKVLVMSGEDEARTVHFRVANICQELQLGMADLKGKLDVYDLTQTDCVLWRDGQPTDKMQWLADTAVRTHAEVIVIDNASDVFADNENDRTAVRGFMRALNLIAHVTRAAVLLLAHVDKASVRAGAGLDSNTTFSGSTAWNNSARSRWAMVRDSDRQVMLRHEKCNLGPLQEELSLEFDAGSKTFKRFGTVPGAQAAATLVRNAQRAAILRLIDTSDQAGQKLSLSASANNNAFRVLKSAEGFPRMERSEFFSLLFELQREGLIEEIEYLNEHRKKFKRIALTRAGHARVAVGSGAAPMWRQREDQHNQGEE